MKSTRKQHITALKVVAHALLARTLIYGSAIILSILSIVLLLFSTILCGIVRLLCRIDTADMLLSTRECDELEQQSAYQEIKRVEDVRSDWIVVDVRTSSGKKCSLSLHSLICISGNHAPTNMQGISVRNNANSNIASHKSEIATCGGHQPQAARKKATNVINGSKSHPSETKTKSASSKPALLWLHGLGGTAMLSLGVTGIIDLLIDDYDVYALDLPGLGRSIIEWPEGFSCRDATGDVIMLSAAMSVCCYCLFQLWELNHIMSLRLSHDKSLLPSLSNILHHSSPTPIHISYKIYTSNIILLEYI